MKLLMISKDGKILESGSTVFERMKEFAGLFTELNIVVLASRKNTGNIKISENASAHDASDSFFLLALLQAFRKAFSASKNFRKGDFVTAQDPFETGLIALIIAKIRGLKLQLQIHTDFLSPAFARESITNKLRVFIAHLIIPHANSIRVVSEKIKNDLLHSNIKQKACTQVLPVFIDIESINNAPITTDLRQEYQGQKIILIAGRLEREKNIGLALHAFKILLQKIPNVVLIVAGTGSLMQELKNRAINLEISEKVNFLGFVDNIYSLYKTSEVLLVTSAYEGYGLNMLEAAICGLSVVATDVGIAREINAVITTFDPLDIANKLTPILSGSIKMQMPKTFAKQDYLQRYKNTFLC